MKKHRIIVILINKAKNKWKEFTSYVINTTVSSLEKMMKTLIDQGNVNNYK